MARTIIIHESDGEVMAPFGRSETFYRGKWEYVRVTGVSTYENTPLRVRQSLVGLTVPTIFTKQRIEEETGIRWAIPDGSRMAYASDVIDVLNSSEQYEQAQELRGVAPDPLDIYVFEKEIYELVGKDGVLL